MRFVLSGTRRDRDAAACEYVSRKGNLTHDAAKAAVFKTLFAANEEREYWLVNAPRHRWIIEELPRGPIAAAVLRSRVVVPAYLGEFAESR